MDNLAERAGRLMKIVQLARTPGMDAIAVRLNSELVDREMRAAEMWQKAFELAARDEPIHDLAAELART